MKYKIAKISDKLGPIWGLVFMLVSIMFLYCLVIYGLDINISKEGRKKVLTAMFLNSTSDEKFYAVNDDYGFSVNTEEETPKYAVNYLGGYEREEIPYCFTCGYYRRGGSDIWILDPFFKDGIYYSSELQWHGSEFENEEAYPILNTKTNEFYWRKDLSELGPDATNESYRVTKEEVMAKYSTISFMGRSDMDCYKSFKSIYATYFLLLIWAIITLIVKRIRRKKPLA